MDSMTNVIRWIEAGKQVGKGVYYDKEGQTYSQSVAIQKWNHFYVVYFFEILEKNMACFEDFEDDKVLQRFENLFDALTLYESLTHIKFEELTPLKGQRIFNPEIDPTT
jgi:hypothetical protein